MAPDTRRQEVLLFRLLQSCESACSASAEWSGSAQAHHAVETAREQLAELAASGCVAHAPGAALLCRWLT
jgi:hypothetical protein